MHDAAGFSFSFVISQHQCLRAFLFGSGIDLVQTAVIRVRDTVPWPVMSCLQSGPEFLYQRPHHRPPSLPIKRIAGINPVVSPKSRLVNLQSTV
jgi:hypothetical protein